MAVYMVGCRYGAEDMFEEFITNKVACIGWSKPEAPALHQLMSTIKVSDFMCIKSFSPSYGLYVKAIGIVNSSIFKERFSVSGKEIGFGRRVKWFWKDQSKPMIFGRLQDAYDHMRGGALFEELNQKVQQKIWTRLIRSNS